MGRRNAVINYHKIVLDENTKEMCEHPETVAADGVESNNTYFVPSYVVLSALSPIQNLRSWKDVVDPILEDYERTTADEFNEEKGE